MKHLFLLLLLPAILPAQSPRLVLPTATTDESYLRAAYVLNQYLAQITGTPVETLRSNKKQRTRPLIYLGPNPALKKYGLSVPAHLPDEAVYLQGRDNVFVI
ncbi:MAG TPA: hypothetical protein PKL15_14040, partial [Saprospiraceae bacterium]|nr:hypothetical protein [Saprospiraceae bacterium]